MLLYFTRSPNLVIFVKVIFVIFDFENEKMFYKEYIYKYIYIYILYRAQNVFFILKMTKMTLTKMTRFYLNLSSILCVLILSFSCVL